MALTGNIGLTLIGCASYEGENIAAMISWDGIDTSREGKCSEHTHDFWIRRLVFVRDDENRDLF